MIGNVIANQIATVIRIVDVNDIAVVIAIVHVIAMFVDVTMNVGAKVIALVMYTIVNKKE